MSVQMESRIRAMTFLGLALFGLLSIVASGDGGGGDGGGGDGGGGTTETTFGATSAGVAAKGIIRGGVITAEELDASGSVLRQVGSAVTDDQGAYSLDIGPDYAGGPLLLTITGKPDGSTRMVCDVAAGCGADPVTSQAVAFGDALTLTEAFKMTAIVPPVANGASISAQITPYTHMAARRALAAGTLDANTVKNAISEVNQMVGVNILDIPPVDITDPAKRDAASPEARAYAAFLAGAGELALAGGDLQSGLDQLATAFEDGVLDDSDPVDPAELLAAVQAEAANAGVDSDPVLTQILATMGSGINGDCTTGCSYDPQPADTATQSAVEKARDIVAQTRAWGTSLADLETPLDAFGSNLDTASAVLDANSRVLGETLGFVLDAVGAELGAQAQAGPLALTTYTADVVDNVAIPAVTLGQATVTLSDNGGLKLAIVADGLSNGVAVALDASSSLPATNALGLINAGTPMSLAGLDLGFTGSVSNAQASMRLDRMDFTSTFDTPITVDPAAATQEEPVLTSASLTGGLTLQANGATFSGDASITFVPLSGGATSAIDSVALSRLSLKKISLGGDFSDANGNSFTADFSLTANNAETFDTLGGLACGGWQYVGDTIQGDPLGAVDYALANSGYTNAFLEYVYYDAWNDQTVFEGIDQTDGTPIYEPVPGDVLDVTGYLTGLSSQTDCAAAPVQVSEASYYYSAYGNYTSLSGKVYFGPVETATDFANLTLNLTMDLALTGYPDTTAVITANRTAQEGGDLLLTLSHGGQSVTFSLSKADMATPGEGTLTVTTPDGAELLMTLVEGNATGTVKIGDTTVATVEETDSGLIMVRYSDGTFETLQ